MTLSRPCQRYGSQVGEPKAVRPAKRPRHPLLPPWAYCAFASAGEREVCGSLRQLA
jgi:hypothetical protein